MIRNFKKLFLNNFQTMTRTMSTGKFTRRSPKDKWVVKNVGSESDENIW